ncbi:DUF4395 domain-containing protein [Sulfurimonas crateris]|uniref:DUF4395 domain-containing protein n=1 Tax=Sulfurimonas crateris TaxID=2574727 RepID=A0A4U2ZAG4_9BACT|nr:DUF4395 domain-containing protein [Sulfurimonas crateris]TKI71005.1 DUF4395 domain-containing protein [Sulfurimonas crateris]
MGSCPVIFKKVDQNVVRVMAGLVSAIAVIFIISPQLWLLTLLLYDFLVRSLDYKKASPIFHLAKIIAKMLGLKKIEIDAGAKEFALKIGFVFVLISFIMFSLGEALAAVLVVAVLLVCAFLELTFNYCVGCQIYKILKKFTKLF